MTVRDEVEARAKFEERYGRDLPPAAIAIESAVLGGDYGGVGYTTMAQVDRLAGRLRLTAGDRVLDVGAGRGWPGLYLARSTGCAVVLTDLPVPAMRQARRRAAADGLADRAVAVVASARHLPFRPECFDVIVSTDVLC